MTTFFFFIKAALSNPQRIKIWDKQKDRNSRHTLCVGRLFLKKLHRVPYPFFSI